MLSDIEQLLMEGNFQFQDIVNQDPKKRIIKKGRPKYPILFLTCMDPRINVYKIFQLETGDAFILRNAGNICTLDMMRSIIFTIYKHKVENIIVLGHFDCGMTKINMTELSKEIPYEFFKTLSSKYSDFLLNLYDFFKPFDNEISNVIHQINDLQVINKFFPDVEIIGMVYDTQTGWVFQQDDFKDLLIKKNQYKIYERLLSEKKQQCSKFLEERKSYQFPRQKVDETHPIDLKLLEKPEILIIEGENINSTAINDLQELNDLYNAGFQIKMPKIRIPKIYIPKLRIYIPRTVKTKVE